VTSVRALHEQVAPVATPNVNTPPRAGTDDGRSVTEVEQVDGDGVGEGLGDGDGEGDGEGAGDGTGDGEGEGSASLLHPTISTARASGASRESSNRIMIERPVAWRPPATCGCAPDGGRIDANSTVVGC
jgi:hypothetical protein